MRCKKIADLMSEYIDNRLAASACREFESHIEQCDRCASELEAMRRMIESLGSLSGQRSPVDCWAVVSQRISQENPYRAWWRFFARPVLAVPSFAAALLLCAFLLWPAPVQEPPVNNVVTASEYRDYVTAHARLQRQQRFTDPDVEFISAELETASLRSDSTKR